MNPDTILIRLRRLQARRPANLGEALSVLIDTEDLLRDLVAARDATRAELARVTLSLDATRAYGGMHGKTKGAIR